MNLIRLLFFTGFLFITPALAAMLEGVDNNTEIDSDYKYKDSWNFRMALHSWLAGLSGQANIQGTRIDFNAPFSNILQQLDFSLGAELEVNRGLWTIIFDPDYVKITQRTLINGSFSDTTYESTMTDAGAYYRLYPQPTSPNPLPVSAELFGGGRIITLHTSDPRILQPSDTSNLLVPLLGLRVKYYICPNFYTWFIGDLGGFQVGHVSSTWTSALGLTYQFKRHFEFNLGYKAFGVNYSIQAVSINTQLQGPELGLAYNW